MKNLTILTISARHDLLPEVANSIIRAPKPDSANIKWLIKFNPQTQLSWNEHIRIWNETLKELTATWVLILSDDNMLHPDFCMRWASVIENPSIKMIHLRQEFSPGGNFRPARVDHLTGGKCDGGQIAFDVDYYNSFGYSYDEFGFEGNLFRKIYEFDPKAFAFVDETSCFHDALFWKKEQQSVIRRLIGYGAKRLSNRQAKRSRVFKW